MDDHNNGADLAQLLVRADLSGDALTRIDAVRAFTDACDHCRAASAALLALALGILARQHWPEDQDAAMAWADVTLGELSDVTARGRG